MDSLQEVTSHCLPTARKFIISSHSLFSPSILPSWHHHFYSVSFILLLTSCCILASCSCNACLHFQICKCYSSRLGDIISSDDLTECMFVSQWVSISAILDLLVSVVPDLLCFLRGSWGIHLGLSLGEFVFGICRFLQSCKTYYMVLCGVFCTNRLYNVFTCKLKWPPTHTNTPITQKLGSTPLWIRLKGWTCQQREKVSHTITET